MTTEADIHYELHLCLSNALRKKSDYYDIVYDEVKSEVPVGNLRADIVVYANHAPFVVIEAKAPMKQRSKRDFDPYSPVVIDQAFNYAGRLGAKYFATYNGKRMVVFRTFEAGRSLLDRKSVSYEITDVELFAEEFLREIAALDKGVGKWDPRFQAFIARLSHFHERLQDEYLISLNMSRKKLKSRISSWMKKQGWEPTDPAAKERFASQSAYLLMNKLLFYKTLQSKATYDLPDPSLSGKGLSHDLRALFDLIIDKVDFEAIYEHDPIFDELKFTENAEREIEDFMRELKQYALTTIDEDVIGELYQRIIPPEERHDLGQYYTPAPIVDLIVRLCVSDASATVLDPGCGSGSFLISTYDRLRKQLDPSMSHQAVLSRLYAFDINRFPLHLAAMNLAMKDLSVETREVQLEVTDFFDVIFDHKRLESTIVGPKGSRSKRDVLPPQVDAVVGNPPYIRQELIDKKKVRKHLQNINADIGKRADIYVYFFTHGYEFLKDRGRLGFITSSRWLTVEYGEALQDFLSQHFRILAVIDFQRQIFDIPLIGTCVTILEECSDPLERNENIVKMILIKEQMPLDEIVQLVETPMAPGRRETPAYRCYSVRQQDLAIQTKWNRFVRAPPVYWEILENVDMVSFEELAEVSRGLTTGANAFFYFRSEAEAKKAGIPPEATSPLLKHIAETDFVELRSSDLTWRVLDLEKFFITEGLDEPHSARDGIRKLKDNGHLGIVAYIRNGVSRGYPDRSTLKSRRIWYHLGSLPRPPILFPEVYWREARCLWNKASAVIDKRLYTVTPKQGLEPLLLLGFLNSSLTLLLREMHGRTEQGEGMNRNSMMVYELKAMPVPDLRNLSVAKVESICSAMRQMMKEERTADEKRLEELQSRLDEEVMSALGLSRYTDRVQSAVFELIRSREMGAGMQKEPLVESEKSAVRVSRLRGAHRIRERPHRALTRTEQKKLDDYVIDD